MSAEDNSSADQADIGEALVAALGFEPAEGRKIGKKINGAADASIDQIELDGVEGTAGDTSPEEPLSMVSPENQTGVLPEKSATSKSNTGAGGNRAGQGRSNNTRSNKNRNRNRNRNNRSQNGQQKSSGSGSDSSGTGAAKDIKSAAKPTVSNDGTATSAKADTSTAGEAPPRKKTTGAAGSSGSSSSDGSAKSTGSKGADSKDAATKAKDGGTKAKDAATKAKDGGTKAKDVGTKAKDGGAAAASGNNAPTKAGGAKGASSKASSGSTAAGAVAGAASASAAAKGSATKGSDQPAPEDPPIAAAASVTGEIQTAPPPSDQDATPPPPTADDIIKVDDQKQAAGPGPETKANDKAARAERMAAAAKARVETKVDARVDVPVDPAPLVDTPPTKPPVAPTEEIEPVTADAAPANVGTPGSIEALKKSEGLDLARVRNLVRRKRRVQARKVRRVVRHIDPWSVLTFSVLFHLAVFAALLLASVLVWNAAEAAGTIENLETFILELGDYETFEIKGDVVFRAAVAIAGVLTLASSVLLVLLTVVFNLISDLVGGIRLTVIEEETVRVRRRKKSS